MGLFNDKILILGWSNRLSYLHSKILGLRPGVEKRCVLMKTGKKKVKISHMTKHFPLTSARNVIKHLSKSSLLGNEVQRWDKMIYLSTPKG